MEARWSQWERLSKRPAGAYVRCHSALRADAREFSKEEKEKKRKKKSHDKMPRSGLAALTQGPSHRNAGAT